MRKDLIKKEIIEKIKEIEIEIEVSLESMISEVAEHTSLEYINIIKSLMDNVITETNVVKHIEIWSKTLGKNNFLSNELQKKLQEQSVNIGENLKDHIDRILSYMQQEWNNSGHMFEEHFKRKHYEKIFASTLSFRNDGTNSCPKGSSITMTEIFSLIINVTSAPLTGKGKCHLLEMISSICTGLIIPVLDGAGISLTVDLLVPQVALGTPSLAFASHIMKDTSSLEEKVKQAKEKVKENLQNSSKNFKENIQYNLEKAFFLVNTGISKEILENLFCKQNYLLLPFQPVFSRN
jgi:ABC-type multidrug transport system fused ATPase/permease subunit